jgi:hypothetical protein
MPCKARQHPHARFEAYFKPSCDSARSRHNWAWHATPHTGIQRGQTRSGSAGALTRRINDGVVVVGRVELLGGAGDGHATRTLLLLRVHVERKRERALAKAGCLLLELLELTLGDTAQLEQQAAGCKSKRNWLGLSCLSAQHGFNSH